MKQFWVTHIEEIYRERYIENMWKSAYPAVSTVSEGEQDLIGEEKQMLSFYSPFLLSLFLSGILI